MVCLCVDVIWSYMEKISSFRILISLRLKNKQTNFPEDETIFHRQGRVTNQTVPNQSIKKTDWNTAHRITKVLANETEYVTYFLILFLAFTISSKTPTTRQIIYGCTFLMSRYLHNSGLIFRSTYARLIGFILSNLILAAITFDLAITLSIKSK